MNREISMRTVEALESLAEDRAERKARRAPIISRGDKAAGRKRDTAHGPVISVDIAAYLASQ